MFSLRNNLLCLFIFTSQFLFSQGWLGKNLSDINVTELSKSEQDEIKNAAKLQGLNDADLEAVLRSRGVSFDKTKEKTSTTKSGYTIDTISNKRKRVNENILQSTVAIYGQELFGENGIDFIPNNNIAPTSDYVLGPSDELAISIFGLQEENIDATISSNGTIKIPYGGQITLSGLTISEAERLLITKLKKVGFYSLSNGQSKLNLQITKFRTIRVMVWGAKQSGVFLLPSTSTAFHALFSANGPGLNRSYRNINIIRNGKIVSNIDLYELLSMGTNSSDITLKDNDIIFIPFYERRVRLRGEVKTPAVFELLPNENILSAIKYSGGYTEIAYEDAVEVIRYGTKQKEFFNLTQDGLNNFEVVGSEIITIPSILNNFKYRVKIDGAIERPGYYSMANGLDLKKVIEIAGGPKKSALNDYIVISSKPVDARRYYSSYNLDSVLAGTLKVDLRENDEILIGDSLDLYPLDKVKIFGDVINQGEFEYGSNLSISKLLYLAGGFKKEALTTSILISRKIEDESKLSVVDKINSKRDFWNDDNLNEYLLKPGDIITVSKNPFYREQINVILEGELNVPGVYPISTLNQNLFELVRKAGGINKYGDVDGSYLIRIKSRTKLSNSEKSSEYKILNELYQADTLNKKLLQIKADSAIFDTIVIGGYGSFDKIASAFILKSGDRFIVPSTESTVKVKGAVYNENTLVYKENNSISQYISLAGGLTEEAKKNNIYVLYSNGMSSKSKNFLVFSIRPKLKPGCLIIVPYKKNTNNFSSNLSSAEKVTLYSVVASTVSSILFMINQITL